MMNASRWRAIDRVAPRELGQARHQTLNAVQWLARVMMSCALPPPARGGRPLQWIDDRRALTTPDLLPGITLELLIPSLSLEFKDRIDRTSERVELDRRTPEQIDTWVLIEMSHRGLDATSYGAPLPWQIAQPMTGDYVEFAARAIQGELTTLANWLSNAEALLQEIASDWLAAGFPATPVGCWPQGLLMATLLTVTTADRRPSPTLSVGLSPGNEYYNEPFFYVVPSERPRFGTPPSLGSIGHWNERGFTGAVLTASSVIETKSRYDEVLAFLMTSIAQCREALS
ncbi:MAG: hypothetical protein AB7U66_10475 [Hyphomicrobiaceae bacterium]